MHHKYCLETGVEKFDIIYFLFLKGDRNYCVREQTYMIFHTKINLDLQSFTFCFEVSCLHPHLLRGILGSTER